MVKRMSENVNKDSKYLANYIRTKAIEMTNAAVSSHIGSILSCADILAVLYIDILRLGGANRQTIRDRFIMSKGHAAAGLYACLAGLGLIDGNELINYCKNGSNFSGHVNHKLIPFIDISTGSLGHGLPISCGIALALRLKGISSKVFCLMSDGELDEGSNWEAMLFASHHKLSNIKAIIDRNNLQSIKSTEDTLSLEPLISKLKSFNWIVSNIDGHDHEILKNELSRNCEKPHIIIANTIKGKGVSFMEDSVLWHYKPPNNSETIKAIKEINNRK
tara:strand:+ start:1742 stop:2569 length:828 start_codon:yes stop_codon:yes gene_type:complete